LAERVSKLPRHWMAVIDDGLRLAKEL